MIPVHIKNSFLHFTLNVSMDKLNQVRGILPFSIQNLFANAFRPTFCLMVCVKSDEKIMVVGKLRKVVGNYQGL